MPILTKKVRIPLPKVSVLKAEKHFSVWQLAIFMLAFAGIGGYIIYRNFAATVATVQAESMTLPAGASSISDSNTSGGRAVKMTQNGSLTASINLPSNATGITVTARADQCSGSPTMTVSLDNSPVAGLSNLSMSNLSYSNRTATTNIATGTHTLSITGSGLGTIYKTKGKRRVSCNRNLYVDVTIFAATINSPTVTLTANPTGITSGQSSSLSWTSTDATSCTATSPSGWTTSTATSGNQTISPTATTLYSLTCTGADGTASTSASVTVNSTSGGASGSILPSVVRMAWYPVWVSGFSFTSASFNWQDINEIANFALETTTTSPYLTLDNNPNLGITSAEQSSFVTTAHAHNVLALLTIGGASDLNWSTGCSTANQTTFANAIVGQMNKYGYDGIDLDVEDKLLDNQTLFNSCMQTINKTVKATTTAAGKVPIMAGDVISGWAEPVWAPVQALFDQIGMMSYDSFCVPSGCNSDVGQPNGGAGKSPQAYINAQENTSAGKVPANKLVFGVETEDEGYITHNDYVTLAKLSGTATSSSIPVSPLTSAISAGNIVLATTENPPAHSQVVTTTGAPAGATSIPISGNPTLTYTYGSGMFILSNYRGPVDCGNIAAYVKSQGLLGVATWEPQGDANHHNGKTPCMDALAQFMP